MILRCQMERLSDGREDQLPEMERGEDQRPPECGEVVLVGTADSPDEAVHARAPKEARDLWPRFVVEHSTQATTGQPADVELPTEQSDEELKIVSVKQIEAAEGRVVLADRSGDLVQVLGTIGGHVERGEKLEVAPAGSAQQLAQDGQAVDRLLDGSQLELALPVTQFRLPAVLEKVTSLTVVSMRRTMPCLSCILIAAGPMW